MARVYDISELVPGKEYKMYKHEASANFGQPVYTELKYIGQDGTNHFIFVDIDSNKDVSLDEYQVTHHLVYFGINRKPLSVMRENFELKKYIRNILREII